MENKTAEDKPDFEELAIESLKIIDTQKQEEDFDYECGYADGCGKIWDDYVTPLKKRIEELEGALLGVNDLLEEEGYIDLVNKIKKFLNPSSNGK